MKQGYLLLLLTLVIFGCKENETFEFDRTALLTDLANDQILPNYGTLRTEINTLNARLVDFRTTTSLENLTEVQNQFTAVYLAFENVKMYEFGPALTYGFRASMNTYPTNPSKINANIESGSYVLGSVDNTTAIGLPALDYLLFGGTASELLDAFTTASFASNRMDYLADLVAKMKTDTDAITYAWENSYKTTFITADGTDIGSSLSLVFNQFVIDLELVKNAKIGIPAGQFSGGETFPTYVESFYQGNSKNLALANLAALKNIFTGGTKLGFDDYMDESVEFGTTDVPSSLILDQFEICEAKIMALENPLSATIPTDITGFNEAFQELKKLVAYAKTDIPEALGVLISFSDTDGD